MCVITAWAMQISGQETETYNLPFDNVMECCMMPDMQHALITTRTPLEARQELVENKHAT